MKSKKLIALLVLISLTASGCSGLALSQETGSKPDQTITTGVESPGETTGGAETRTPGTVAVRPEETKPVSTKTPETSTPQTKPPETRPPETRPPETRPPQTKPPVVKSGRERLVEGWEGRIYPGIMISGFKVGGLTFEEAEEKMEKTREKALARKVSFTAGDKTYSPTQKELGVDFDYDKALEKAKTAYSELSVDEKARILETSPELMFYLEKRIDEEALKAYSKKIADAAFREATEKVTGRRLYRKTFEKDITERIRFTTKDSEAFKASMETAPKLEPPKPVEPPKPAEPPKSQEPGKPTDPPKTEKPKEAERGTISRGKSKFDEKNVNRSFNVRRGAAKLDGVVVKPGEVFSFNRTVGAASKKNGYRLAGVYSGDILDEGYGGGICQVSSTMYNAVIHAGLQVVERHSHSFTVTYLPKGMDAAIYYGSMDLKFKNTLDHSITIRTSAEDGLLSIRFVSDLTAMDGITYDFSRKLHWEGEENWNIRYTSDLKPGKSQIVHGPHPAAEVSVYRTTYKNDKEIKTEFFDRVKYRELKGVKLVGKE